MDERSLIEYVTRQRWYGAKSRTVSHSEVLDTVTIRQAEPQLSLALVEMRFDTGTHDVYQLLVSGGDEGAPFDGLAENVGIAREIVSAMRAGVTIQGSEGVGRVQPGRGLLRAGPRARRRAARLLRAVEQLDRLRRRADPQGLPPPRARDQPGARDAPLPHRAGLPQHPGARRLVRRTPAGRSRRRSGCCRSSSPARSAAGSSRSARSRPRPRASSTGWDGSAR